MEVLDVGCAEGVGKEPPVPEADVLRAIKSLAPFVARMGPAFEALALQKHSGHPAFRFLYGGEGAEYYRWQVCFFTATNLEAICSGFRQSYRLRDLQRA